MHTIPALFWPLKAVQRDFGIQRIRISHNLYRINSTRVKVLLSAKAAWNFALRNYQRTRTTEGFTSLADFCAITERATPRVRTLELMVHPGDPKFGPRDRTAG